MAQQDQEQLAVVATAANELEAGMIVAALERHGIRARASGVLTAGFRAEAPGRVRILVRESELERAEEVLDQVEGEGKQVDWSEVDVGDPDPAD